MTFFLNAAQRQTSGLDPFTQVCNAAEHRPAVAKYRDTARQAAAKTERHDPRILRKGRPGQGSLYCTWSRGPGRARGARGSAFAESSRSSGSTRPHTDAATTLRVCILVEHSVTLAVLDFLCKKKENTIETPLRWQNDSLIGFQMSRNTVHRDIKT